MVAATVKGGSYFKVQELRFQASLSSSCPLRGERCRVTSLKNDKVAPKPRHATVARDHIKDGKIDIEDYKGNTVSVPVAYIRGV